MRSKAPSRQTERHSEGTQPRRGLGAWVRRGLVWMIAGLLALAVIGAVYPSRPASRSPVNCTPCSAMPGSMAHPAGRRTRLEGAVLP